MKKSTKKIDKSMKDCNPPSGGPRKTYNNPRKAAASPPPRKGKK